MSVVSNVKVFGLEDSVKEMENSIESSDDE